MLFKVQVKEDVAADRPTDFGGGMALQKGEVFAVHAVHYDPGYEDATFFLMADHATGVFHWMPMSAFKEYKGG